MKDTAVSASADVDLELVKRVQRGDKNAFNLLMQKYQHKIAKLIGRYIRDPHEAQDVTQEAFIKAYRGLKNFRGESAFYTWMYRIAINTAKNYLISLGRKTPHYGVDAEDAEQFEGVSALKNYDTPEHLLLTEEIKTTVEQTINSLPAELKTAIILRELEGMSYEEIAEAMDCPIGTVRSRIFRAREAIDVNLKPLIMSGTRG
ncbi:MAG: RNA polymerase sigma factor RpoE [Gammaproteobacteria bacterium]|nr:RNA polymerase sigma factor RpoE [Gammaproteobacteria bacterium]